MRFCGSLLAMLALVLILLSNVAAQDEKKKDPEKKEVKTDADKPEVKKKPKAEEKVVYGGYLPPGRLTRVENGEFTVEVPLPDAQKISQLEIWSIQQLNSIAQDRNPVNAANRLAQYQYQLQQKQQTEITSNQNLDFRAAEKIKIRAMFAPQQTDDMGNLKKWTAKELRALKSKYMPGYPADMDALRVGQTVQIYIAKAPPAPKTRPGKKKLEIDETVAPTKQECVMIVVLQDVMR